ncbi:MAG TPA: cupredoxin family copper-binding protein [Dehalococcoidia bacterium]|nr:cupredoxin family copper-binding protein [Dehalococcoidia bacterium]
MNDTTSRQRPQTQAIIVVAVAAAVMLVLSVLLMLSIAMWGGRGMGFGMGSHGMMMGGGSNTSGAPLATGTASQQVEIRNFAFAPGNLQVPVGAKVTWTNYDDAPHSATAKDGSWDTGILNKGESKTLTFDKPGDYTYYCVVHPSMVARITVK